MIHEDLNNIQLLSEKIEKALADSDFTKLATLSSKLETMVQLFTDNSAYKKHIKRNELDILERLIVRVNQYQVETETKFKDYTLRISKQTKMQNAYKQSRS